MKKTITFEDFIFVDFTNRGGKIGDFTNYMLELDIEQWLELGDNYKNNKVFIASSY